ncbi:hypothetical protein C8J56DRAFT_23032 [Mycena floridula]|nr:hypothetical protein C8J56DRAFT_23032 [Mycena floridula]
MSVVPYLRVANSEGKGRGIFASRSIPSQTLVETSPVIVFSIEEYENHGKHTILDHYTFRYPDGRMALALGLGSLFNHSEHPNVKFSIEPSSDSIVFTAVREIQQDEELCIFYGHNLWFQSAERTMSRSVVSNSADDDWGGLSVLDSSNENLDELMQDEDLPFLRLKPPPDEEDLESIPREKAWVVDVPDSRQLGPLLKWLKLNKLDDGELGHLKRIRKQNEKATFLITTSSTVPDLPSDLNLPEAYQVDVPTSSAQTQNSLALKSTLWPTMYTPRRKGEPEPWSRGKVNWAWQSVRTLVEAASKSLHDGELPIVAYVPPSYEDEESQVDAIAFDTRTSTSNPLRHAVLNLVRQIADLHSSSLAPDSDDVVNGRGYLLTSRTIFLTHEPCIMCSMALLHSRVKEVIYLVPMPETGGCGGATCLPFLQGVNHRFTVAQWTDPGTFDLAKLQIDACIDG